MSAASAGGAAGSGNSGAIGAGLGAAGMAGASMGAAGLGGAGGGAAGTVQPPHNPPVPGAGSGETWQSFEVTSSGAFSMTTRTVEPSGRVTRTDTQGSQTSMLRAQDQAELFAILGGGEFQLAMQNGSFACPMPPQGVDAGFALTLASGLFRQQVTGCVYTQGGASIPGQQAKVAFELVTAY